MLRKRLLKLRPFSALIVVAIFWLFAPIACQTALKTSFYEFQAPVSTSAAYMRQLQDFWATKLHSKTELYEAGQKLARLNATYELKVVENNSLKEEVKRLESLYRLPTRPEYQYEIARVVERDISSWWHGIVIRKGKRHGIPNGAPVVFAGGVVGRVHEVHEYTSVVELVSNSRLRLAVVIEGDNRPISFTGAGAHTFGSPVGLAQFVNTDISANDKTNLPRLITSGLGGVFPAGLHVGYLNSLRPGSSGMFLDGDVILDKRLLTLTEVAILVPIAGETE